MQYLPEFIAVAVIHLLAVISPGPDFILILKNSLTGTRRAGVFTALGLAFGIMVHVTYSLIGIGFIISQSILLFSILKYAGAAYLIYIGIKSLRARPHIITIEQSAKTETSPAQAIKAGFLTNVLNPKATLFFFALFTQVISPQTPKVVQVLYGVEMSIMTFLWFSLVAVALSHQVLQRRFGSVQHRLEQMFGVILIALGIKIAFSTQKN